MHRRHALRLAGSASLAALFLPAQAQGTPSFRIPATQIQETVSARFPAKHPVGGLFELLLEAPDVRLLPDVNRVGAAMNLAAAGPALSRRYTGLFDLDFALRYQPSDQTIRAQAPRVNTLRLDGLSGQAAQLLAAYGPTLAEEALADAVLYKLQPKDLALADGLGLQPGEFKVGADGITVTFVPKAAL